MLHEFRAFARAVLGVLHRAFPFDHGPSVEVVVRQLRENRAEIDLPVAEAAEAARALDPALETAVDALPPGRIEFGILDVEHPDPVVVDIDII